MLKIEKLTTKTISLDSYSTKVIERYRQLKILDASKTIREALKCLAEKYNLEI